MPPRERSALPLIVGILGLVLASLPGVALGQDPPAPPLVSGDVEAVGNTFTAQSDSMLLQVAASDSLRVGIHMAGTQALLSLGRAGESSSVHLTISGYPPYSTLFVAIDSLLDLRPAQTDSNGVYAVTLDITNPRLILLQRWKNTLTLTPAGWSDPSAGTWNPGTLTGTLTRDIYEQIVIAGNNLTLDGAGHSCIYTGSGSAVSVSSRSSVTIRNLQVLSRYDAIMATDSPSLTVRQCYLRTETASSALYAWATTVIGRSDNLLVTRNTLRSPLGNGIVLRCGWFAWFRNPVIKENDITATTPFAIGSYQVDYGQCYNNNITSVTGLPPTITKWNPTWSYPPPVGGNHWNVWTTPDANADGFVDVPFVFTNGRDDWPYAQPQAWGATGYTIVASAGPGGTISPSGNVPVAVGASQMFTIAPEGGYDIENVLVDGSPIGLVSSYTFSEVIADHTIAASFVSLNRPPVLSAIADMTANEEALLSFTATASDPDVPAQPLTFTLVSGPPVAALDPVTGVFTWTPAEAHGPGDYPVTIKVSDNGTPPLSDQKSFTIHVNEVNKPPVLADIPYQAVDELQWLTVPLAASDPDLPPNGLAYSLGPGAPPGAMIDPHENAFVWQPGEPQGPGDYPITILVTDSGSPPLSDQKTFMVHVREVNLPPLLSELKAWCQIPEEEEFTFFPSATDPDLPPQALRFSLDGAPEGATIDPVSGTFAWTPSEAQGPGDYTFTVRVTDDGTPPLSDEQTITIHVNEVNLPPVLAAIGDQTVNEMESLTLTATATDPDLPANTLAFSLVDPPAGASIDPLTGALAWTPDESQGPGVYTLTVRVTDDGAPPLSDEKTFRVTVNEINVAPLLAFIPGQTTDEMTLLTFTASATDPDLPANTLTFSLVNAAEGMSIDPGSGVFSWTPTEAQGPMDAEVTVKVTDDGLPPRWDEQVVRIHVNEVNRPPVLTVPGPILVDEGATIAFAVTATDPDLPANTLRFALVPPVPPGASLDPVSGVFTWVTTHEGVVTLQVQASDGVGGVDTRDVLVNIGNVSPTAIIFNPTAGSVYAVGENVMFAARFLDPGSADTHTAVWTFDGITVPCAVNETEHSAVLNYAFTAPGVYMVSVAITDDGGGVGMASTVDGIEAMVVVYDATAGFVTGGGWIQSPLGAYTPNPALTGKANFGFVSKYKRGETTPTGETEFQFKVARLNFHSTAYQWLTVGGSRAQYKGTGTINGVGDYGFVLTAVDGDIATPVGPDKLRMKIWERASGTVVYDNQLAAPEGETPTTVLEGGSIVIHTGTTYQRETDPLSMRAGESEGPLAFALLPAAPNPFRGTTQLAFDLPEASHVRLTVHDVAGREVAEMVNGTFEPGRQQCVWEGRDRSGRPLEAGVYFARIEARSLAGRNGLTTVRKLVLVK